MSAFRDALTAHRPATGVHALDAHDALIPGARYESALVFGLPDALNDYVEELRRELALPAPSEDMLAPHLTVLFVGHWTAETLEYYRRAIASLAPVRVEVVFSKLGFFGTREGISNVHLAVESERGLRSLHAKAIVECAAAGWTPQTDFLGPRYSPHVSVFDRLALPASLGSVIEHVAVKRIEVELTELTLIGKVLDA